MDSDGQWPDPVGVYHGIRVLDLSEGLAGAYAAMFLADNGADVVKVERPGGDPYRDDPGFQTVNRNKASIVPADEAEWDALATAADLVIAPDHATVDRVRGRNQAAVIVAVPPWGRAASPVDGPEGPVSSSLLHAATGLAWNQQSYREAPIDLVVPLARYATGVLAALAAAAGLYHRARTAVAARYEVSEVAGAAAIQVGETRPADQPAPVRPGDSMLGSRGRVACYRLVEAGDGQWLFVACGTRRFFERLLDVMGRPELIDDPDLPSPPWGLVADEAVARFTPILEEVFATRPRDEWLAILAEADVPAQPVQTREQFLGSSLVTANDQALVVEHPELGPVTMMGVPVTVEEAPGSVRSPAPLLDQHHHEVLDRWRGQRPTPAVEGSAEHPLAGIRVMDLASFIAGPVVSRHLAMLGAEVVKVEPPTGDPFRTIGPLFLSWNQGKRSLAVDLTTGAGRATALRLAARSDVVVENFRPGVAGRLGVDHATLSNARDDLVFLSQPGYGADPSMLDRPAFDPLIQALGGLMAAQGGVEADPSTGTLRGEPVFLTVPIHDVVTPLLGALGVVMGLHHRLVTGRGQHVHTSLVESTLVVQAAETTRYRGRPPAARGGFDHPGPGPDDTWEVDEDGTFRWRCHDRSVEVLRTGLSSSPLALDNDMLTTFDHAVYGPLVAFGQLIRGAGPPPGPPPLLDQHGSEVRAEIGDRADEEQP